MQHLRSFLVVASLLCASAFATGCASTPSPRPVHPGEHAISVVTGGPIATVPNIGQIPMPNATVEGHHGVAPRLELNWGVHLLPLAYGVAGAHVGMLGQLFEQPHAAVPALSVGERLFAFTNLVDGRKGAPASFGMSQTDLLASWLVVDQLVWVGGALYAPFNDKGVFLAPVAGIELHALPLLGLPDVVRVGAEARWLAPSVNQRFAVVDWTGGPDDQGVFSLTLGATFAFGGPPPSSSSSSSSSSPSSSNPSSQEQP